MELKDPVTKRLKQKWFNNLVEPKTEELDNDLAF